MIDDFPPAAGRGMNSLRLIIIPAKVGTRGRRCDYIMADYMKCIAKFACVGDVGEVREWR